MVNQVAFFDSNCLQCNAFINFVINFDKEGKIKFSKIHGDYYQENIRESLKAIDSIIYVKGEKEYVYSDAIVEILADSNSLFKILYIQYIVPTFIRKRIYRFFARRRKRVDFCPLPDPKYKDRFI